MPRAPAVRRRDPLAGRSAVPFTQHGRAVKPIPVVFHLGPLQIHTYGIGLAITFWFGYRYFAKRLRDHGYPDAWLGRAFIWIVIASVVGARPVHVVANLKRRPGVRSRTRGHIRHLARRALELRRAARRRPDRAHLRPALVPAAATRRGPRPRRPRPRHRLERRASARAPAHVPRWRQPDPRLVRHGLRRPSRKARPRPDNPGARGRWSSISSRLRVERRIARRGGPIGVVATAVVTLYGAFRFNDEYVLLPHNTGGDIAVIVASLAFVAVGAAARRIAACGVTEDAPTTLTPTRGTLPPDRNPRSVGTGAMAKLRLSPNNEVQQATRSFPLPRVVPPTSGAERPSAARTGPAAGWRR